jgi:hypothetical protein
MRSTTTGVSNEACLAWLEGSLREAFKDSKSQLWAYLEAVIEEVLFELEVPPAGTAVRS